MLATSRLAQEKKLIKVELRKLHYKNSDLSMLYVKKGRIEETVAKSLISSPQNEKHSIFKKLQPCDGTFLLALTL